MAIVMGMLHPALIIPTFLLTFWGIIKVNVVICQHCRKRVKFGATVCRFCGDV